MMGENDDLPHSSIEQLGRVLDDQRNLGEGGLMPDDGKVIPIDRLMIDSQKTGFESLQFPLEQPLHFRVRIKFDNGSKFGWSSAEPAPWSAVSSPWNEGDGKVPGDCLPRSNPIQTHCDGLRNNGERIGTTGPPAIPGGKPAQDRINLDRTIEKGSSR